MDIFLNLHLPLVSLQKQVIFCYVVSSCGSYLLSVQNLTWILSQNFTPCLSIVLVSYKTEQNPEIAVS
jgi:hypothetical protein